ncbi:MAG TPA: chemotaxis protein CheR, partial [Syntrophorhabdus aromaticivorans]|nr:chemotaxis protein CheR [Syntrophorhabdus aromaticivorans]
DGMPRSAIATGLVDYVLPPAEMPTQLLAYAAHAFGKAPYPAVLPVPKTEGAMKKIFVLVRAHTGHDFSLYKHNTVHRRVERRMSIHQIDRPEGYLRYLQQHPDEVTALFRDLLIGVTSFFRDPEAFAALETRVIPRLFDDKLADEAIRVWVPGCSTGEEAYSIAILLQECIEELKQAFKIQIFATDIDGMAIDQARAGVYSASIANDVSKERLARFFSLDPAGGSYRIRKGIRDMIVFSEQDVIKDPPFSRLDLISCRNLLIYMGGELQKKLIPLFHYSLNPAGHLFLGTSETVGEFQGLFATLDRKSKLYQCKEDARGRIHRVLGKASLANLEGLAVPRPRGKAPGDSVLTKRELTERTMLQEYAASGVLVNERGDILYIHGRTGLYLEPVTGEPSMNILKMAREGLRRELTAGLHKAVVHREPVRVRGLRIKSNGGFSTVHLLIRPAVAVPAAAPESSLCVVILEKAPATQPEVPKKASAVDLQGKGHPDISVDSRIKSLQEELRNKEEYLQSVNEELETSNEELKSSNEEMQSMNEELQSTNEELETSKEELQSVNEELSTVNTELQTKVADLSRANNDMNNLLAGTGVGIIFVDLHQHILRFTPAVTQVINLIPTDIGRPVGHIVANTVGYDHLVLDVQAVLDTLAPKEVEVQSQEGTCYLLRIHPYRTLENVIEGAVITFIDITEIKKAEAALRESEALRRLAAVVRDAHDAITVQDLEGRILAWNPGAERMYGWSETEALAMNIGDMVPEDTRKEALPVIRLLNRGKALKPYRMSRIAKDGRVIEIWLTATALTDKIGNVYAITTTERMREKPDKG